VALADHRGPLRAALRASYGIDLRNPGLWWTDLADLVVNLPPGSPFWRAVGGPLAWSDEVHALMAVEHRLRVLAWQRTKDGSAGRNQPAPVEPPPFAEQRKTDDARLTERVAAYQRRIETRRR
jgi:hypothetical protein